MKTLNEAREFAAKFLAEEKAASSVVVRMDFGLLVKVDREGRCTEAAKEECGN